MPTAIQAFQEAAATYGRIDPSDANAVREFFVSKFADLAPETQQEILTFLLRHESGASPDNQRTGVRQPAPQPRAPALRLSTVPPSATRDILSGATLRRRVAGAPAPLTVFSRRRLEATFQPPTLPAWLKKARRP